MQGSKLIVGSREVEGNEAGNLSRMQVHKVDVTDNFMRDCAAAESHVLEENSHRRI